MAILARAARLVRVALLCAAAALAPPAGAEGAKYAARAHLEPSGQVMPGQPVKLVVDAITTTWFTSAPVFPPVDIPGAVVTPPGDTATNLSEDIRGERWFGVSRTYVVTPQAGGELAIPPIVLQLHVGQVDRPVQAKTPALKLSVKQVQRPPGAENALASSRLVLTQALDRGLDGLKQGDAFTRTVTVSAAGLPGMLLPPVTFAAVPGLAMYPKAPRVQDKTREREGFTGSTRVDAATYVLQRAGHYELPGVSIAWWDTSTNQLRTATAPPLAFDVAADPAYKPEVAIPAEASAPQARTVAHIDLHRVAAAASGLLLAALLAWLLLPRLLRWTRALGAGIRARRQARQASEAILFARLEQAIRQGPKDVPAAVYRWLDAATSSATAGHLSGDRVLQRWMEGRYGAGAKPVSDHELRQALRRLRSSLHASSSHRMKASLPATLNPAAGALTASPRTTRAPTARHPRPAPPSSAA
jgi:hypothetical protein